MSLGDVGNFLDNNLLGGAVANLGAMAGDYDSGCATGLQLAGAGFAVAGDAALLVIPGGDEAKGAELAEKGLQVGLDAGLPSTTKVWRVFGGDSRAMGHSWTTVDPATVSNFRDLAGLPNGITGQFYAEGFLEDWTGVVSRDAEPLEGNAGGLPELSIPNPETQIRLVGGGGINPAL
jgi:hypothetical protein